VKNAAGAGPTVGMESHPGPAAGRFCHPSALHHWRNLDANRGLAYAQLVALLEGVPGGRFGRPGLPPPGALADVLPVGERAVAAAQVAHQDGRWVDVQYAVVPRDSQELRRAREVNVAVARAADDVLRRPGELPLLPLEGGVGELEDDLHSHLLHPFSGQG